MHTYTHTLSSRTYTHTHTHAHTHTHTSLPQLTNPGSSAVNASVLMNLPAGRGFQTDRKYEQGGVLAEPVSAPAQTPVECKDMCAAQQQVRRGHVLQGQVGGGPQNWGGGSGGRGTGTEE